MTALVRCDWCGRSGIASRLRRVRITAGAVVGRPTLACEQCAPHFPADDTGTDG